ncbi:MAG TPA: lipoyl(octanoyl) transferase LipB [Desulfobacterales bacterium]|nr:lipoyl(octanoyl) transferase LipB [Desulfobacterales bacterium]
MKTDSSRVQSGGSKRWHCLQLSAVSYSEALDLQHRLVDARINKIIDRDIVLLLEHPPVFTLGRRGGLESLKISEKFLEETGIPIFHTERGGTITFHGPGQVVLYPIIRLRENRMRVVEYVTGLEEIMIRTAGDWGIRAERNSLNRGVWVGNRKLGSIGISVRRGITFHGLALNVNLSLEPFGWIHPCGLPGVQMTSMREVLSSEIAMNPVRRAVRQHIESVFAVELEMIKREELRGIKINDLAASLKL